MACTPADHLRVLLHDATAATALRRLQFGPQPVPAEQPETTSVQQRVGADQAAQSAVQSAAHAAVAHTALITALRWTSHQVAAAVWTHIIMVTVNLMQLLTPLLVQW